MIYEQRLIEWNQLRVTASLLPLDESLALVNSWWFKQAWTPYYLHWDDVNEWPNPWDLLYVERYCDISRGLGIAYTLLLINESAEIKMTNTVDNFNIVIYNDQYILNYSDEVVLNKKQFHPTSNIISKKYFEDRCA